MTNVLPSGPVAAPTTDPETFTQIGGLLGLAVQKATGNPEAQPRGGQGILSQRIWDTINGRTGVPDLAAVAPTGSGKSLAYLVPAALSAALDGKRAVISTESLALQAQIVDKDAPVVVAAVEEATGQTVQVELLKGWSNWVCVRSTLLTAYELLGYDARPPKSLDDTLLQNVIDALEGEETDTLFGATAPRKSSKTKKFCDPADPANVPGLRELLVWALKQHMSDGGTGNKDHYPAELGDQSWQQVSVAPAECVGTKSCPLAAWCKPDQAKERAAEADVVVTNHSMIATQAAKGVAAVVGSKKLGWFDTIIVDEAHALPAQVRNQGACEFSGRRIGSLMRAVGNILEAKETAVKRVIEQGERLSKKVDEAISVFLQKNGGQVARIGADQDVFDGLDTEVTIWCTATAKLVSDATEFATGGAQLKAARLLNRLEMFKNEIGTIGVHVSGYARWVEKDATGVYAARCSPVNVSNILRKQVWTVEAPEVDPDQGDQPLPEDGNTPELLSKGEPETGWQGPANAVRLNVIAVSATLQNGFDREAGLTCHPQTYPSPFTEAYGSSLLYVPRITDKDLPVLSNQWGKFDTKKHLEWAKPHLLDLVETNHANQGGTLVLTATATAGKEYADYLREHTDIEVLSQWDGRPLRVLVSEWKQNPTAVLVGTKSLMTGVDAPGITCSLVVIDRIPRAAGNPVDDARVEDIVANARVDKWSADRLVYVADAALLLEQAAGRLIRSEKDRGVVAVLDPRLLRTNKFKYNEPVRNVYHGALGAFVVRDSDPDNAKKYLNEGAFWNAPNKH